MTVDIHAPTRHDALSLDELALYHAIMRYRADHGLPAVPLSKALTTTAGRHVLDTRENIWPEDPQHRLLHDWSDARYHGAGGSPEAMWFAPDRLGTGYEDPGYEIAAAGAEDGRAALEVWKDSPAHDDILTNSGPWADRSYRAIGIGVETAPGAGAFAGRVFYVWFGEARDAAAPAVRGSGDGDRIPGTRFGDRLHGLGGDDRISGGRGHDAISGGAGEDRISGGRGDDRLSGGPGDDALNGGPGKDRIAGGPGDDVMSGGVGTDTFVFADSALGDRDRVTGFRPGVDRLHLAGIDADATRPGDQAFDFIGTQRFDGTARQLNYRDGVVAGDADGEGRADFHIRLTDAPDLTGDDFLF